MKMWQRQLLRFLIFAGLAISCWLVSCTTAQIAQYEKSVDSRSIEGYAKDGRGGVKYTVHYK